MSKKVYILWMIALSVISILLLPYIYEIFRIIFLNPKISIIDQLSLYQWAAVGFVAYGIFHKYVSFNLEWLETDSHEKIHGIVGWLFGRRIHSAHSEEGSGCIYTSGNSFWSRWGMLPMSLAPYCLPLWTYSILWLRPLIGYQNLWIFDILIGITLAFHYFCFKAQTRSNQTDINQYPLSFSYAYIYLARIINGLIVTVMFFPQSGSMIYPVIRLVKALAINLNMYIAQLIGFLE